MSKMIEYLLNFFGKPSRPEPGAWFSERWERFKKNPVRETFKYFLALPVILYLLAQLWPFITDLPYLIVFLLTLSPFAVLSNLRRNAQKSITLTLMLVVPLYFCMTKPLVFPPNPDSLLFNERFFKFENYQSFYNANGIIPKLFPLGTLKEKVDRVLINYGGASLSSGSKGPVWRNGVLSPLPPGESSAWYNYKSHSGPVLDWRWAVNIIFDGNNKVKEVNMRSYWILFGFSNRRG